MKNKVLILMSLFFVIISIILFQNNNNILSCRVYKANLSTSSKARIGVDNILIDKNLYFAFGALINSDGILHLEDGMDTIAIKKTNRKNIKKWDFFGPKLPGTFSTVTQTDKNLFLIGYRHYRKHIPPYVEYTLYRISKKDGKYKKLHQWKAENCYVRSVFFLSDTQGAVFFEPSGDPFDSQLYWTNDGGKHWQYRNLNRPVLKTHLYQNKLYFLSYKCCNNPNNWIYSMQMDGSHLDSLQFDIDITDFAVDEKGFWLLGQDTTRTKTGLWHYDNKNGKFSTVKIFVNDDKDFFPTGMYKYNELLVVFISRIDKSMLLGLGGTRPYMFVSKDNGKTWHKFYSSNVNSLNTRSFYKDKRMLAYIMPGEIFICNFDEMEK